MTQRGEKNISSLNIDWWHLTLYYAGEQVAVTQIIYQNCSVLELAESPGFLCGGVGEGVAQAKS